MPKILFKKYFFNYVFFCSTIYCSSKPGSVNATIFNWSVIDLIQNSPSGYLLILISFRTISIVRCLMKKIPSWNQIEAIIFSDKIARILVYKNVIDNFPPFYPNLIYPTSNRRHLYKTFLMSFEWKFILWKEFTILGHRRLYDCW